MAAISGGPRLTAPLAYTVAETALLLGVSRSQVYVELRQGRLASFTVGRRRLIPHEAVDAFVAARLKAADVEGWPQ